MQIRVRTGQVLVYIICHRSMKFCTQISTCPASEHGMSGRCNLFLQSAMPICSIILKFHAEIYLDVV